MAKYAVFEFKKGTKPRLLIATLHREEADALFADCADLASITRGFQIHTGDHHVLASTGFEPAEPLALGEMLRTHKLKTGRKRRRRGVYV